MTCRTIILSKNHMLREYMYMFLNELEEIMWILLENAFVENQ